ncbi:DUF2513 domain-containing protein [Bacillus infantis]|uniref:DUF2513 domain-containing protein n=1 Tax=Bacillus infantis TaxID=324767 RepID=UPI00321C091C
MKRDMDLIRRIMLEVESMEDTTRLYNVSFDDVPKELVNYHVKLLIDAGLVEGQCLYGTQYSVKSLTWNGHEFLDNAKNPSVWSKTKSFVAEKGGSASMSIMMELVKQFALKQFELE